MAVKDFVSDWAQSLNDQWADGDVWHKAAIHDINVDPVSASSIDSTDLESSRWQNAALLSHTATLPSYQHSHWYRQRKEQAL
jgi:hypothetical protein